MKHPSGNPPKGKTEGGRWTKIERAGGNEEEREGMREGGRRERGREERGNGRRREGWVNGNRMKVQVHVLRLLEVCGWIPGRSMSLISALMMSFFATRFPM